MLEEGELRPGGETTTDVDDVTALLQPAANLGLTRRNDFQAGVQFFQLIWVPTPGTAGTDGLGPTFVAERCARCHDRNGRGAMPRSDDDDVRRGVLLRLGVGDEGAPDPRYGSQLQPFGVDGVPGEAWPIRSYELSQHTLADGTSVTLSRPHYELTAPAYGAFADDLRISPRLTPQVVGQGLLEAIPEDDLLALADPDDRDGDGISGRAAWLRVDGAEVLGRFGWKAAQPDVAAQSAAAFHEDLGITSPMHPEQNCTSVQSACISAPRRDAVEITAARIHDTAAYLRLLAVPARPRGGEPNVLRGKAEFSAAGCTHCHHPSWVTGADAREPELAQQRIWPYTDLLLHDMGERLADHRPEGAASGTEWRTPPLWTLGILEKINGERYLLHDGRARTFEEAILWHGGEADASRLAYERLPASRRTLLIEFLESL